MKTLNKPKICHIINRKTRLKLGHDRISDILSIFFEEFFKELEDGKELRIPNFCSFRVEKTKPKRYHDIRTGTCAISKSRPQFKIRLMPKLKKKIAKELDLLKTFIGDDEK